METAHQRLQSQSKTRSGRIAANTTRPLLHQRQAQQAPTSHHGASPTASPLALFVTNLKLLDLDLLPDWPGVSPETFAVGASTAQSQKKRIQCVEWVLFQLFALWDPDETANRIKPFFPPLDQVQSLNLRAALLRALEQAKKNGALGRDAVLRKTMLDECKGERLEEVLASFSTAVLKKVAADQAAASGEHPALALSLALEDKGYKDDKTELSALTLAHKISLLGLRARRKETDAKFRDFADLLGVKERGLTRRNEEARHREEVNATKTVSGDARLGVWRTVRNNWSGNEQWMETLLHGDAGSKKDSPFDMPFDRVWRRIEQNRLGELEAQNNGLLEQLDDRVRLHKERLAKWQGYRRSMFGEKTLNMPSPSKDRASTRGRGIDLGFIAHEDLRVGKMSPRKPTKSPGARINSDYRSLLDGLEAELAESDDKPDPLASLQGREQDKQPTSGADQTSDEEISEMSELEDDSVDASLPDPTIKSFQTKLEGARRFPVRPKLTRPDQSSSESVGTLSRLDITRASGPEEVEDLYSRPSSHSRDRSVASGTPSRTQQTTNDQSTTCLTEEPTDQVLESTNSASPSPSKRSKPRHTLSLAERTRLSMAPRGSSLFLEDEDSEPEVAMAGTTARTSTALEGDSNTLVGEEPEDLTSRARRSMAGFEKARQKAQLERRRSQRRSKLPPQRKGEGSYFPRVDEDQERGALTEELMGEEDMEAVFKSRPKIKASPLPSPNRELDFDDEYT